MVDKFLQFMGLIKRAGKLLEGYNKCEEAIRRNRVYFVIMSQDVSKNTWEKFLNYNDKYKVPVVKTIYTGEEIGSAIGSSEIKVVGVTDKNMSKALMNLLKKNEKL
ncbi:ribosomal L7Ae/L30e/S12e/Gadd45 family protein [Clostridium sp. AWRP]|uniref:ribosomal L7Ae/L30e/S12e/Gadd45 family protein n=1 Tax=Clostridium sp. AWRP TaxID=2212991 RepID=UPI000FDA8C4F|nr:ribosomal L7Ae/L30e/S12e/Gadd45 family protein [Clostridium sp. AWRP]AZV56310.1 50S ribosomal protein L7ae-like protein [Clostridium sp. AWRP]